MAKKQRSRSVPRKRATRTASLRSEVATRKPIRGVHVGQLVAVDHDGLAYVALAIAGLDAAVAARSVVALDATMIGRDVVVQFEAGDPELGVVLGIVWKPESAVKQPAIANPLQIESDGTRVSLRAAERVVLQCGEASITLTSAGKIILRGHYILSHSSGVNGIQGGAVQIN